MTWLIGLGALMALAGGLAWWALRRGQGPAGDFNRWTDDLDDLDDLDVADVAELEQRFAAVDLDEGHHRDRQLAVHLDRLIARRIPVRSVEAAPTVGSPRIRFADGTAMFVHGEAPGDVGVLAMWTQRGSVLPVACSTDLDGAHLALAATGSVRRVSVLVSGLDQPD
jgi:hypothetical protein